jgi:release factor glutamine methyltransferase
MREGVDRPAVIAALRAAGCVFAEDEAEMLISAATDRAGLDAMVARRAAGEPIEYVVGWAEFCGRRVLVEPGVFVPRVRTEVLAGQAVLAAAQGMGGVGVVDLCCGSGAIGLVVASSVRGVRLVASDVDPVAVACARRNLRPYTDEVFAGDLFAPLPADLRGFVDVLVTNVPYVPSRAIALLPSEAREHEPRTALDGGPDGLDVLRRIAHEAPRWLATGGRLLMEASAEQADEACAVLERVGLRPEVVVDDEHEVAVVSGVHKG